VIDVFDALVSRRPYKEPWEPLRAAQEIENGAGTQFDPTVVPAFLKLFRRGSFDSIILAAQQASTFQDQAMQLPPNVSATGSATG